MVGIPLPKVERPEMRPLHMPRVLTPNEVYEDLGHEAQSYANWLEANVKPRDRAKKPEKLNWVRVLDITTKCTGGHWCSALLAEQEAEVILLQPPQYDPTGGLKLPEERLSDEEARRKLLRGRGNKMSLSLNLEIAEGRELFRKLVVDADVLVEDYFPGQLEEWGIGYRQLSDLNPGLVYVRVGHQEQSREPGDRTLNDYMAGAYFAMWIIGALKYRDRVSGQGKFIDANEVAELPYFKYRGHVLEIDDLLYGKVLHAPAPQTAQKAPPRVKWIGRPAGIDNEEIYRKMFGVKKQDIEDLKKKGVI